MTRTMLTMAACSAVAGSALAGTISSLTCTDFLDNHESPTPRIAGADDEVGVPVDGRWFASGACELSVDGEVVAALLPGDPAFVYELKGAATGWRTYRLDLRSGLESVTRYVTLFPYAGYACGLHWLSEPDAFLDSRPAGTVRKLRRDCELPIVWSGRWNAAAEGTVVKLYQGREPDAPEKDTLVSTSDIAEGVYRLDPQSAGCEPGICRLTHFDGVETLEAYFSVPGGIILIVR